MSTSNTELQDPRQDEIVAMIRCCSGKDPRAWDRLLSTVRDLAIDLGRWKYRLGSEDAEDLAQVVQIRVAERLPQLRDPAAFPSWVRRLIHCAAVDILRQRRPTISLDEPLPTGGSTLDLEAAEQYEQLLLRTDLDRALVRLPARYREPIELHLLEGISQEDVGRLLSRPRNTVACQIDRGLRRLQRILSPAIAGR